MKTILLVDDEEDVLHVLAMRLESLYYRVLTARDGMEGVSVARREIPDLVILDLVMPVMNGLEALHRLRGERSTRRIPVVVLTCQSASSGIFKAMELGAVEYLIKTCSSAELVQVVERALQRAGAIAWREHDREIDRVVQGVACRYRTPCPVGTDGPSQ